ncbi:SigE family RNA polymerase sigma factor [Streptomyces phaeochromogenes]|uniref:SigE family RNA polymerase sigma factor n=1 Tax=Streptomyces phaeochromogenes TaxID=1923 RepID=UPI00224F23DA|nr:SigE family RNA polymerase sigma factor [Streptomyces phaeochromogenes]MCX5605188.1 SigE family RNA polymerase sigma factor [Streptomyces phaeochromogenes]
MKAATILAAPAQTDGVPAGGYRPVPFPARAWADALHRAWRLVRGVSQRREEIPAGRPPSLPGSPAVRTGLASPGVASPGIDEPGIDELYSHRRLDLVRLALLLVDDLPTAEDVVQDVFAALYRRHGERLAGLDNPDAYLRTSVVNTSRSVLRRRRTVRAHVPERQGHAPSAEEPVLLREEHGEVIAALHRLTRRQREVLVLRYWSHLSEAQIADTLGLSRGAVKSTASRALSALRRQLEDPR